MNMAPLCQGMTSIEHKLISPTQLLYSKVIKSNLLVKIHNIEPEKDRYMRDYEPNK